MLAELVHHVVGIDPDRDRITASLVEARTRGELARREFPATPAGYRAVVDWADELSEVDDRVWSIEGTGSYGSGLCSTLGRLGEWVIEFDWPSTRSTKDGAKSDGLDAYRAATEVLGRTKFAQPRGRGVREAMRGLLVTRKSGQRSRVAAINELKAFVVTCSPELREDIRGLGTAALVKHCAAWRPSGDAETAATKSVMRIVARRIRELDAQIIDIDRQLSVLAGEVCPQLLDEYGIGPFCAAQIYVSWSHPGRCRNDGAFARLGGAAPIEATSGQTVNRHRLNRGGDRQLNRALHTVMLTRVRNDPDTRAYVARAVAAGRSERDARRALKRYIARRVWRLLEHPHLT
jgi:transposase